MAKQQYASRKPLPKSLGECVRERLGRVLYCGSGVRFFFIGTAEEFSRDIAGIDAMMLKKLEMSLENAEKALAAMKDPAQAETRQASVRRCREALDSFVPFEDRAVVDHYKSIRDPDGEILIVEGSEVGDYITRREYLGEPDPGWHGGTKETGPYVELAGAIIKGAIQAHLNGLKMPHNDTAQSLARTARKFILTEAGPLLPGIDARDLLESSARMVGPRGKMQRHVYNGRKSDYKN